MDVNSQLLNAQLENLTSEPTNKPDGRIYLNTTDDKVKTVINTATKVIITEDNASDLKITPVGNLSATTLPAALTELQDDIDALTNVSELFDTTTGHDHDGTDSKKVLGTNIDSGATVANRVLKSDGSGGSTWGTFSSASVATNITSTASNYVVTLNDDFIIATAGGISIQLGAITASANGKTIRILHDGTNFNSVTIDSGSTIKGATGNSITGLNYKLWTKGELVTLLCNGTDWYVIEHRTYTGSVAYTPLLKGSTTNPTLTGTTGAYWCRSGDKLQIHYEYYQTTASTNGSGVVIVEFPTGCNASPSSASNPIDQSTTGYCKTIYGFGGQYASAADLSSKFSGNLSVRLWTSTSMYFAYSVETASTYSHQNFTYALNSLGAPIWNMSFSAEIPIPDWQP